MPLTHLLGRRSIARCELHTRKATSAARRLVPYLLVKREQALLVLEVSRIRDRTDRRSLERHCELEAIHRTLLPLRDGRRRGPEPFRQAGHPLCGYQDLGPPEHGWTKEQVYAYLAGIMDSDGSFRVKKRHVVGMLHPQYRINIRCAQVAPSPAIDLLARTFGGSVAKKHDSRPNTRDLAVWSLHDRAAASTIRSLLPYLVVKTREAWLLLELRRLKAEGKKGVSEWVHANRWRKRVTMRKRYHTPGQVTEFERICRQVHDLHSGRNTGTASEEFISSRTSRGPAYRPCSARLSKVSDECLQ